MTTTKTVRVGVMPGRINEYAVEVGTSVADVIALAELSTEGFEVKVDGTKVDPSTAFITEGTSLVLLAKQVKGNSAVRIGVMPGRINEYALDSTTTIASALEVAGLSTEGYEVKVDGVKVTDFSQPIGSANLILLAKQVKGNSSVRIGVMPGRINEFALAPETTLNDALAIAELSADGYEVKIDGVKATDFNAPIGNASLILLAKQVKGNHAVHIDQLSDVLLKALEKALSSK